MRAYIKTTIIIVIVLLVAVMPVGCAVIPADITELESPPKLTAEQQSIVKALESHVGGKVTYRFPLDGDYRSAFIMKDLDYNGVKEAIAFYSPSVNSASAPHIAILNKSGNSWKIAYDIGSDGNEIGCIAFGDFNGDGFDDIAVGWRTFNSTDLTLIVYIKNNKSFSKVNLGTFTKMKTLDIDKNGKTDIILLKLDSDEKQAVAKLISYRNGKLLVVSSAPLDSTVTNYRGVYVTKLLNGKDPAILIDGAKSENKFITEVITFSNGRLHSPLYDPEKHTVNSTMRFVDYRCTDINNDGIIEVPMPVELPSPADIKSSNKIWLVRWSVFDGAKSWTTKLSCVMNTSKNYYFKYPDKWNGKVTVSKQDGDSIWTFCEWDENNKTYGKSLFSICVTSEEFWNNFSPKSSAYKLQERNGAVYYVQFPQTKTNDDLAIGMDEINEYFNLMN